MTGNRAQLPRTKADTLLLEMVCAEGEQEDDRNRDADEPEQDGTHKTNLQNSRSAQE
jgi:hypothetical protein